jgi:hypothetical protein
MSQEHENAKVTDSLPGDGKEALSALRGIWKAQGQTSAALDEACGNTNTCKNMEGVGFQGLAEEEGGSASPHSVSGNLRAAWKRKLEREGKLATGTSVRDLIFGSSEKED